MGGFPTGRMNWRRRIPEWLAALAEEQKTAGRLPWWTFIRSLFGGVVPKRVWVQRLRTCATCPFKSTKAWICRSDLPFYRGQGCGCFLPFYTLAPDAHKENGCYAFARSAGVHGWPAYKIGRLERWWSVIKFIARR